MFVILAAILGGCQGYEEGADGPSGSGGRFRRGMWDLSVSGSTDLHRASNDDVVRAVSAEGTPQIGYFLADGLEVLLAAGAEYQDARYKRRGDPLELKRVEQEDYSGALGCQYNFDTGGRMVPFVRLYGGVVESHRQTVQTNIPLVGTAEAEERDTAPFAGTRVGVRYFLTPSLTGDLGLGWKRVFYEDEMGGDTDDTSLTIGVSLLF
jgi:hypothetical protein